MYHNWFQVYAVATEDLDALTFGAPILVRHMTFSEARKEPILEFNLATILQELAMSMDEVLKYIIYTPVFILSHHSTVIDFLFCHFLPRT